MATNVTWNGTTYSIPAAGEVGWSALSPFLIALGNDAAIAQEMKQAIRVATTTPVTVSNTTDCVVATNMGAASAVAVTLPAGTDGRWFVIVDQKGDAATNNITITPNGAETINGAATFVMNQNREGVVLAYSLTNTTWNVVSRFTAGAPLTNPMSTTGDMVYGAGGGAATRLATGATTGLLHGGNAAVPTWSLLVNADVSGSAAIAGSKLQAASTSNTGTVSYQDSGSLSVSYAGAYQTPQAVTGYYSRVGKTITLTFPSSTSAANSNSNSVMSVITLGSSLWPTFSVTGVMAVVKATVPTTVQFEITTSGVVTIYGSITNGDGWGTTTTNSRIFGWSVSYTIS